MRFLIFTVPLLFANPVSADPFTEAHEFCWANQVAFIEEGVEMATGPIDVTGTPWNVTWENNKSEQVAHDRITIPFEDGPMEITGHTFAMADHIITIASHRDEGIEPFAVRYEGKSYMTIPYPATVEEPGPWCYTVPLGK